MLSHMFEVLEKQFLNPSSELEDFHIRITEIINYEWDQRQAGHAYDYVNQMVSKAYRLKCNGRDMRKS